MNKKRLIIIVAVLIVIGGLVWFFTRDGGGSRGQQVSNLDAVDTVGTFYDQWLKAVQEPATADPNRVTLMKSPLLSKTLKDRLAKESTLNASPDPVLCQTKTPENISIIRVYEEPDRAQILVLSRDKKVTEQALVTLARLDEGWYIDEIECSAGEFAPEREFSFEKEGFLLKDSIPKPFDPKNWHLVFEENGELGHVVPLFFDATSQCTDLSGTKAVCKPDQLKEMTKVFVQAQMTERGANLKNLRVVK